MFMPRPHDRYPDEGNSDEDNFNEHERVSDADVWRQIEESLTEEDGVEVDVPPTDIKAIRAFLGKFNVVNGADATDEDIERVWHELARDPSINKDYPYMPTIFKDYAYILSDYRTGIYRSTLPMPPRWNDFQYYSARLTQEGKERFSSRLWIAEKYAVPNLTALGLKKSYVIRNTYGDEEGRIRAAEFTRFLGWLAGQRFMAPLASKVGEFREEDYTQPLTLTNIAKLAVTHVLDVRDELRKSAPNYRNSYPMEQRARDQFEENLAAIEGIYNLCDTVLLGVPKKK
jgi:hypothetical protein